MHERQVCRNPLRLNITHFIGLSGKKLGTVDLGILVTTWARDFKHQFKGLIIAHTTECVQSPSPGAITQP